VGNSAISFQLSILLFHITDSDNKMVISRAAAIEDIVTYLAVQQLRMHPSCIQCCWGRGIKSLERGSMPLSELGVPLLRYHTFVTN